MKRYMTLAVSLLSAIHIYSQVPQKMTYQAIIRDAGNTLLTEQPIGLKFSILQGDPDGPAVYSESHQSVTNINGLVTVEIGTGAVVLGDFSSIDWSAGLYFLKTESDPTGGHQYSITGVNQLLSVPYALHAGMADKLTGQADEQDPVFRHSVASHISAIDTARWNRKLDVEIDSDTTNELEMPQDAKHGDMAFYSGGRWVRLKAPTSMMYSYDMRWDTENNRPAWKNTEALPFAMHGYTKLFMHPTTFTAPWCDAAATATDATHTEDGRINTAMLLVAWGPGNYAAYLCDTMNAYGCNDWYLPAKNELKRFQVNNYTWSSTEADSIQAWQQGNNFTMGKRDKTISNKVRCIRREPDLIQQRLDHGETPFDIYFSDKHLLDSLHGKTYLGGLIVHLNPNEGWGLMAASQDFPVVCKWGCYGDLIPGAKGNAIGTGRQNTLDIIAGCDTTGSLAERIENLTMDGHSDWFLPSKDELNALYQNVYRKGYNSFRYRYWSSTDYDRRYAWSQYFSDDGHRGQQLLYEKAKYNFVRPVRVFLK